MATLVPNYSSAFGRPISADNPALRLLTRYLDFVLAGDETEKREIAHRVSTHIFDLAALALGARGDSADIARLRGARAARLEALRSDILGSLGHCDLSAEGIAARHGISSRYVRKLFEEQGSSFSSFVLAERLLRVQRMLVDRRYAHLNIARIAHENGFGDVSYFNRAFRRQRRTLFRDRDVGECRVAGVRRERRGNDLRQRAGILDHRYLQPVLEHDLGTAGVFGRVASHLHRQQDVRHPDLGDEVSDAR